MPRQEKITVGEMRVSGASRIIVHCGDYKCGHSVTMYPALWPDNVLLSDLEERFVCTICGHRGADVRPLFEPARMGIDTQQSPGKQKPAGLSRRVSGFIAVG